MKISIVVPVYNAEKTLARCLDSILGGEYAQLEVICVNDGSSDGSLSVLRRYAAQDARVRVIDIPNSGPAHARNVGIDAATGEYVGFVDADDYVNSDTFVLLTEPLAQKRYQLIIGGYSIVSAGTAPTPQKMHLPFHREMNSEDIKEYLIHPYYTSCSTGLPSLCNKLYNLLHIREGGLRLDEERVRAEDYWFNMDVFQTLDSAYAIEESIYNYVLIHADHVMSRYRRNQFEMFAKTRAKLLELNKSFGFDIDWNDFDSGFIQETNSFILQVIQNERNWRPVVQEILLSEAYRSACEKCANVSPQIRLLYRLVSLGCLPIAQGLYWLWSKKH